MMDVDNDIDITLQTRTDGCMNKPPMYGPVPQLDKNCYLDGTPLIPRRHWMEPINVWCEDCGTNYGIPKEAGKHGNGPITMSVDFSEEYLREHAQVKVDRMLGVLVLDKGPMVEPFYKEQALRDLDIRLGNGWQQEPTEQALGELERIRC